MKPSTFILKSLKFYWRQYFGIVFGMSVCTAILTGALIIGDSVKGSLVQLTLNRLGKTEFALQSSEGFFADRLARKLSDSLGIRTAPLIQVNGIAINQVNSTRATPIQVNGVDERFWQFGINPSDWESLQEDDAIINTRLANQLNLQKGDIFLLRVENISTIPREIPLVSEASSSISYRLTVKGVADEKQLGNFNLQNNQVAPLNVFLSIKQLSKSLDLENNANILLIGETQNIRLDMLNTTLEKILTINDVGFEFQDIHQGQTLELTSKNIFIKPAISDMALSADRRASGVFTYFVNQFKVGDHASPYFFIAAPGSPIVNSELNDNEIIINTWLAQDLQAKTGDSLTISYFVPDRMKRLIEKKADFIIHAIIPISGAAADQTLMPDIRGLSDSDHCRDWEPGIPLDLSRIRDKDEEYWDRYRGTPKAFVTLNTAQKLWANRFGNLTAIRYPNQTGLDNKIAGHILKLTGPSAFGLVISPVRQLGVQAGMNGVDFGQLFLGLSFFILLSAVLVTASLFTFEVERRSDETAILTTIGFPHKLAQRLFLSEGLIIAVIGTVFGVVMAIFYTKLVLIAMGTIWKPIIGTSSLSISVKPATLIIGSVISIVIAFISMLWSLRKQQKMSIQSLIGQTNIKKSWKIFVLLFGAIAGVVIILTTVNPAKDKSAAMAFGIAGVLLLIAGITFFNIVQ